MKGKQQSNTNMIIHLKDLIIERFVVGSEKNKNKN